MEEEREQLEREGRLGYELKVCEFMERLQDRPYSSIFDIPDYLPTKSKELLVELATVETEIAQLQRQINEVLHEVKHEKEAYIESMELKSWESGSRKDQYPKSSLGSNTNNRGPSKKVAAFEKKALHFITKAIKGDHKRSNVNAKDKPTGLNEKYFCDGRSSFRERGLGRAGIFKTPSSLKELQCSTPRIYHGDGTVTDVLSKIRSMPLHAQEESIDKWSPNRLSENMMRCLISIFMGMHRTSRAMELEKSEPITRSAFLSLSFRANSSSNSNLSQLFEKHSRQQDPYSIFNLEDSIPRDIGHYKNLVRFTLNSMDLRCIRYSGLLAPLFHKLEVLKDGLRNVDLKFSSNPHKLAFWINVYNACIMNGFLEEFVQYGAPPNSDPNKLLSLINKATLDIAGHTITAQVIERFILRKPPDSLVKEIVEKGNKDAKELILHEFYGLKTTNPNILFALCYGTRSSPTVKIYTVDGLTSELERSKLEYLQAAIMVTRTKRILLPELLIWNMHDFAPDLDSWMEWLCQQLPVHSSLRKSIIDYCFRGDKAPFEVVGKLPYDFGFQFLLPYET